MSKKMKKMKKMARKKKMISLANHLYLHLHLYHPVQCVAVLLHDMSPYVPSSMFLVGRNAFFSVMITVPLVCRAIINFTKNASQVGEDYPMTGVRHGVQFAHQEENTTSRAQYDHLYIKSRHSTSFRLIYFIYFIYYTYLTINV
jgi:hypothetical protein